MNHVAPIDPSSSCTASRRCRRVGVDTAVRRGLHIACLVLWLAAMGLHWDVLQVFAWANMLRENLRTLPTTSAVARTFQPEGMCRMCKAVQVAKHQQQDNTVSPDRLAEKAPLLIPMASRLVVAAPLHGCPGAAFDLCAPARRDTPPTPPPRVA